MSVYDLRQKVDLFIHELPKKKIIVDEGTTEGTSDPGHLGASADARTSRPAGSAMKNITGVLVLGLSQHLVSPPVTGAIGSPI